MRIRKWHLLLIAANLVGVAACGDKSGGEDAKAESDEKDDDKDSKDSGEKAEKDDDDKDEKKRAKDDGDSGAKAKSDGAWAHLPASCDVVASFDISKVMGHDEMQKKVVPLIKEAVDKDAKDDDFKEFQAFLKETKLDVTKDLQTMAVCVQNVPADPKFAIAVSGNIKKEALVPAMEKQMDDGDGEVVEIDGRKVIKDKDMMFGQADDGTILFGNDESLFKTMNKTGDNHKNYALTTSRELAFAMADGLAAKLSEMDKSMPEEFKGVKTVSGSVDLSGRKVEVKLTCGTEEEAEKVNAMLVLMKSQFEKDLGNEMGEKDMLKGASSKQDGKDVVVTIEIPKDSIEKGVGALADQMKAGVVSL